MDQDFLEKIKNIVQKEFSGDAKKFTAYLEKHGIADEEDSKNILQTSVQSEDAGQSTDLDKKRSQTSKIIQLNDIHKEYRLKAETIKALKRINLEIFEGEIVALVGSSGSGKSTLLNLLGGLDTPTSGSITINGKSISQLKDFELSRFRNETIGFIFQFFYLQPFLNVQENVEIPLTFAGMPPEERHRISLEVVKSVGLENRIRHLPNQLSGGQMQRVAIARALVNKPKIILADEPTGNLDRATGNEIMELIKKINQDFNTTVIIVTHDEKTAEMADRQVRLSDGEIQ